MQGRDGRAGGCTTVLQVTAAARHDCFLVYLIDGTIFVGRTVAAFPSPVDPFF